MIQKISDEMAQLVRRYNRLTCDAEQCFRDNLGKLTASEAEYYRQAASICEQILDLNLTDEAVRQKWQRRKNTCLRMVEKITEQVKTESGFVTKNACEEVSAEEIKSWHRKKPSVTFDDLVGMENFRDRAQDWKPCPAFDKLLRLSRHGASWFFYGLPGTGKSMCMHAIAAELMDAGYRYIALSGSDIHSPYLGEAEKKLSIAFQEAMDNAPCVLIIDDIENVCASRADPHMTEYQRRLTITMLQCLSALIDFRKPVLLLTATNSPDLVDEAFIDHSRSFRFPLPSAEYRADFFAKCFGSLAIEEGFPFQDMATATDGYLYRDLEHITEGIFMKIRKLVIAQYKVYDENGIVDKDASDQAALEALESGAFPVTRAMFDEALRENPPLDKIKLLQRLEAFENRYRL